MSKIKIIKCPGCKKEFNYFDSKFRPFCTERCKMIDLGHWLAEDYSVAAEKPLEEEDIIKIEKSYENGNKNDE